MPTLTLIDFDWSTGVQEPPGYKISQIRVVTCDKIWHAKGQYSPTPLNIFIDKLTGAQQSQTRTHQEMR